MEALIYPVVDAWLVGRDEDNWVSEPVVDPVELCILCGVEAAEVFEVVLTIAELVESKEELPVFERAVDEDLIVERVPVEAV